MCAEEGCIRQVLKPFLCAVAMLSLTTEQVRTERSVSAMRDGFVVPSSCGTHVYVEVHHCYAFHAVVLMSPLSSNASVVIEAEAH